ncbi:tRNA N6-adenosine threonylcarbamoyltransferase [Phlyctochytrium bullatum]|nr:tRNA N6-adenosine threonylcarbamoyltransferase [Phlyctochytrium bullatum]
MTIVFGDLINTLLFYGLCNQEDQALGKTFCEYPDTKSKLNDDVKKSVTYLLLLGTMVGCAAYLQMGLWMYSGERQTKRIREEYLQAVLRQEIAFFDQTQTGDITTRLTGDIHIIQEGISDKVGAIFQSGTTFVSGFVIAFTKGWRLALVLCSVFPLLAGTGFLMAKTVARRTGKGSDAYAQAGAVAQEVFAAIRTVVAFGGEKKEIGRYGEKLNEAEKAGIKVSLINGATFWYGGTLIGAKPNGMSGGEVLNVFFSIIVGATSIGQSGPILTSITSATGAAKKIFATIDRRSAIDAFSESGERPETVEGAIEFKNVRFHYPQRPDVPILKDFSLSIRPGQTVALVGGSGCGKSTTVKLLERFYNPVAGTVKLDGRDISALNVSWLREQIGFVGQEPVLFDLTVKQNILFGLPTAVIRSKSMKELDDMVQEACIMANAWGFIQTLPEGLDTSVGEAGSMLSGGQKQRIAIARAIIRKPKILLLDEATSALDAESEQIVQHALDKASANRTTIAIVMDHGEIVEMGRHNDLLEKGGVYANLVKMQALRQAQTDIERRESLLAKPGSLLPAPGLLGPNKMDQVLVSADDLALARAVTSSAGGEKPKFSTIQVEDSAPVALVSSALESRPKRGANLQVKQDLDVLVKSIRGDLNALETAEGEEEPPKASLSDLKSADRPVKKKKSEAKIKEIQKKKEEALMLKRSFPWRRIWGFSTPEWPIFVAGLIGSSGNGIFSEIISVFSKQDKAERDRGINFWAIMFLVLAVGIFIANFASIASFGIAGEKLTRRIRMLTFTALVRQEIGFFDEEKNSTGALTARLAEDAQLIHGLVGRLMATIVQNLVTMIKASEIANEAIDQIRTVATLGKEKRFLEAYKEDINKPHAFAIRGAFISSVGFALAGAFMFYSYAIAFYAGSQFVIANRMTPKNVFAVMFSVIFTAVAAGHASSFAPNFVKAKLAAFSILSLLDRQSEIDYTSEHGEEEGKEPLGRVEVENGHFNYPSRPGIPILRGLDVVAEPGQTVALVGPSGCGKSTVIALVERWYDLLEGEAKVSNLDVKQWRVKKLREGLALVGQEPVLFNMSIRENILYGAKEGHATDDDIYQAAKMANIHNFIMDLPDGYDTIVGSKGGQLSGGQKQRVAIARALIRHPKILLLDEATSALDSESERVVQEALDQAAKGRTTIVIAHRLATIQNADLIVVVDKGTVVEQGRYEELVAMKGKFAELAAAQSLGKTAEKKDAGTK